MGSTLDYMDLKPGMPISDIRVDAVFVGAYTNNRIEDIRAAAEVTIGRCAKIWTLIIPRSGLVKNQAEAEGPDNIFIEAGMEWKNSDRLLQ